MVEKIKFHDNKKRGSKQEKSKQKHKQSRGWNDIIGKWQSIGNKIVPTPA